MNTKHIHYKGQQVEVDILEDDIFCVYLPGKKLRLQYKPDNEGADHWLDLESNHETDEAVELGEEIGKFFNN
jgi:hypothetical protein